MNSSCIPVASTISGVVSTSSTSAMNPNVHLPGRRASVMPAKVPRTTATRAAMAAAANDDLTAPVIWLLSHMLPYHLVEKRLQTNIDLLSLKEWATTNPSGRNRKTMTSADQIHSATRPNRSDTEP